MTKRTTGYNSTYALRIKFSGGRQFSSPKSPTSCSCKTLAASLTRQHYERNERKQTHTIF
jgi:hypothetical protein